MCISWGKGHGAGLSLVPIAGQNHWLLTDLHMATHLIFSLLLRIKLAILRMLLKILVNHPFHSFHQSISLLTLIVFQDNYLLKNAKSSISGPLDFTYYFRPQIPLAGPTFGSKLHTMLPTLFSKPSTPKGNDRPAWGGWKA